MKAQALAVDRSVSGNVERTHAIITTLNRIAKNAIDVHQQRHRMFVSAFGLEDISTCDLISLLKYISRYDSGQKASQLELESARKDRSEDDVSEDNLFNHSLTSIMLKIASRAFGLSDPDGISALIKLASDHNAEHAERWIRKCLSDPEAGVLYTILSRDEDLMKLFVEKSQ